MPLQSVINYTKFQESKLRDKKERKKLGDVARPRKCPYCGTVGCMILHQWVIRYLVLILKKDIMLLIPVYRCNCCRRHIRVLPKQCHVYHQYSNSVILMALKLYNGKGKYVRFSWIDPSLMRCWVKHFEENVRSCGNFILRGILRALEEIPRFSILFRSDIKIMHTGGCAEVYSTTQRIFTLAVCLRGN